MCEYTLQQITKKDFPKYLCSVEFPVTFTSKQSLCTINSSVCHSGTQGTKFKSSCCPGLVILIYSTKNTQIKIYESM